MELRFDGRIGPFDEPFATHLCVLAAAVDTDPTNAALHREYVAALRAVRDLAPPSRDPEEEAFDDAVSSPVRDAEDAGSSDAG